MNKLSKKGLLLFVSALAVSAFAMPSLASAVTFDGPGDHVLSSANLGFSTTIQGNAGSSCSTSHFTVTVSASGATATVDSATFTGCTGTGAVAGIPTDVVATNFPWEITTLGSPGNFVIDGVHVNATITTTGNPIVTLEGNLNGAFNNTTNTATFASSTGLTATSPLGNSAATVTGTLTDNQHTLRIT